ncbi:MAG: hypothetical protein HY731_13130 [Candidatus Tectomicrobia bacterium]|nr:hypothetical protein [Candidatus Tectomicrobia bacterium]
MKAKSKFHLLVISLLVILITGCASAALTPSSEGELVKTDIQLDSVPKLTSSYKGRTVAIVSFPDKTILSSYPWLRPWLGSASADFLVEFLIESGFRVIGGKEELKAAYEELELSESGFVNTAKAAQIGKMLGAEFLFVGSVTDYNEVITGGKKAIGLFGYAVDIGGQTINYTVQVAGRLLNVETREIMVASTASYKKEFSVGGGSILTPYGRAASQQEITVRRETAGRVFQKALNNLAVKIVNQLNNL